MPKASGSEGKQGEVERVHVEAQKKLCGCVSERDHQARCIGLDREREIERER